VAPERFGNYLVHERLGAGGMATVHRAILTGPGGFERPVALKRLLPHLATDDSFVRAFVREARIAAQLRHTNVAQTFDLGLVGDSYYIAMELIEGFDLRQVLKQAAAAAGPMPAPLVCNLLLQVCDALDYAHGLTDEHGQLLGIVHRDVSPANIIVNTDGLAKLIDFGIARATSSSLMTMSGQLKGKFAYIAPETIQGVFDARADLFSLGVVAHELLTAKPLLTGTDEIDTLRRVREHVILPPSAVTPGIPDEVDSIVMTALTRDPAERWQSAAAMRGALSVVSSRANLRASAADVARWIQWAFDAHEVRPSARRRAVSTPPAARSGRIIPPPPDTDSGDVSMEVVAGEATPVPARPVAAVAAAMRGSAQQPGRSPGGSPGLSIDATIEEDATIDTDAGPTLDAAAVSRDRDRERTTDVRPIEDPRAAALGAAPASSATLEMLVSDARSGRMRPSSTGPRPAAAPMRPSDLAASLDDPMESAVTLELDPKQGYKPRAAPTASPAARRRDLDAATTGHHRPFERRPEPSTLVDVVEHNILAEVSTGTEAPTVMLQPEPRTVPAPLPAPPRNDRATGPNTTARGAAVPPPQAPTLIVSPSIGPAPVHAPGRAPSASPAPVGYRAPHPSSAPPYAPRGSAPPYQPSGSAPPYAPSGSAPSGSAQYPSSGSAPSGSAQYPSSGSAPSGSAQYPSSGPVPYPSSGAAQYPSSGAVPYPSTGSAQYPSSGAVPYPSSGSAQYPSSGAVPYPSSGSAHQPSSGAAQYPSSGSAPYPSSAAASPVASGTPHRVDAPAPPPPTAAPAFFSLGPEYKAAADSYAASIMTPAPGELLAPSPEQLARAQAPAADAAPAPRRSAIPLIVLCALLAAGVAVAGYFT
jgi:serine/threonine protein kinase